MVGRMKGRNKVPPSYNQSLPFDPAKSLEKGFHLPLDDCHILPTNKDAIVNLRAYRENKVEIVLVDAPLSYPSERVSAY